MADLLEREIPARTGLGSRRPSRRLVGPRARSKTLDLEAELRSRSEERQGEKGVTPPAIDEEADAAKPVRAPDLHLSTRDTEFEALAEVAERLS
jgi:hypothetical protein